MTREEFLLKLKEFSESLTSCVSTNSGDWKVKGFIDTDESVFTISSDSKIVSKILEIQLFPKFKEFADKIGFEIVLAEKQNWYPDLSFVAKEDPSIKFSVDIKTTYRLDDYDGFCNGFTLGSHGEYFRKRTSTKNIQFPYGEYRAHFCLGILYTRAISADIDETEVLKLDGLQDITSVITDLVFFAEEKWKISSDRAGSYNTNNIGGIENIEDLLSGNGIFVNLGENVFDEYWVNHSIMQVPNPGKGKKDRKGKIQGEYKKLTMLKEFIKFKGMDQSLVNTVKTKRKNKKI